LDFIITNSLRIKNTRTDHSAANDLNYLFSGIILSRCKKLKNQASALFL